MKFLSTLEDYLISPDNRSDAYVFYRYRLLLNGSLFTSIFSLLYLFVSILIGFELGVYYMIFNVSGFLLLPLLMRTKLTIINLGNIFVFTGTLAVVVLIFYSGGIYSPVFPWLIAPPVQALLIVSRFYALVWTGVVLAVLGVLIALAGLGYQFPVLYDQEWSVFFIMLCSSGIILIVVMIALIFESNTKRALEAVAVQKKQLELQHQEILDKNEILLAQKEELTSTSEQLKELNEKKDYLMEILAHDLKSPLANIQALIGLLKMDGYQEESIEKKVIDMILDSSRKSQSLIQKILSSENLENIIYNLKLEETDISHVLKQAVDELQNTAEQKKIAIHLSIENGKNFIALIDRVYMLQVFENLINNAIKFSPSGRNIFVAVKNSGKALRVEVKDEGPGIQKEEMGMLFKKFKKLSNKPTGGESSTGLGLSIVKHYTELLKGKVWCESEPGQGSNFIIELPMH
jgi:signal transduction histidine kinase